MEKKHLLSGKRRGKEKEGEKLIFAFRNRDCGRQKSGKETFAFREVEEKEEKKKKVEIKRRGKGNFAFRQRGGERKRGVNYTFASWLIERIR